MTEYCIQAAMFKLPLFFGRFTHDFWVLREIKTNKMIAQLHGLATSRKSGQVVPIGYRSDHSLRAHCIVYDPQFAYQYRLPVGTYALPIHAYHTVYEEEDSVQQWMRAIEAVKAINHLNLDYPRGGFRVPLLATINSNSIYHTFAQVMNIPLHLFDGFFHIGIKASLYEQIKSSISSPENCS
ncbi:MULTISPECIES: hypothetical protein [Legionella]|uniref:Uncharacterized protein n=1 Tax=Legionella drozanskii LLAP-1 TaxID=1212489 RepID=A0A0W0TC17_9GAMM|nr:MULTISPECIES: hypothetical protein [Legionella]KTC93113.1 hypothetical protein Ldro_0484 [Legionella drozanskii LLAP-1]PJE11696.1 MAG: hypothetical protein CK430_08605 [Legionella sp.]